MVNMTAAQAQIEYVREDFRDVYPDHVRRLISTAVNLAEGGYAPLSMLEIADEESIFVNFEYRAALVITEGNEIGQGRFWNVQALAWDQTGGVDSEMWLADVRGEYLGAVVKTFLVEQERAEQELQASFPEGE